MIRQYLLAAATHDRVRRLVLSAPMAPAVAARFVAGEGTADVVRTCSELSATNRFVTIDHLGEDTTDRTDAQAATNAYLALLDELGAAGLTSVAEVSVKLSAIGLALPDGEALAAANATAIAARAAAVGTTVTVDMEDHSRTDATLRIVHALHESWPSVGVAIQAYLRRSETDLAALAGYRVRLCKGAYREPSEVAFTSRAEITAAYGRGLTALMAGDGYPMVATHDPALIELAGRLAVQYGREPASYEYQMLHGVRPDEQLRLAATHRVRIYVPYGTAWYGYMMRRMAEKPANLALFVRALTSRR